jgi:predicted ArsR family transcriptional regulator
MVKTKRKEKAAEPEKPTEKDLEGFLAVLKRLGKPSSSREISDALGIKDADKGRALVRRVMAKLIEAGKVKVEKLDVIDKPEGKIRARKYYQPA